MERNAIPLQNINRNLNLEERQEINNPIVARNNRNNQSDEGTALCIIGTVIALVFVGLAYVIGTASCKNERS